MRGMWREGRGEERQRKSVAEETIVVPGVISDLATGTRQTLSRILYLILLYLLSISTFIDHSYDNFIQSLNILSPV